LFKLLEEIGNESETLYTCEQIIGILHEAGIWLSQGQTVGEIVRHLGILEQADIGNMAAWKFTMHSG